MRTWRESGVAFAIGLAILAIATFRIGYNEGRDSVEVPPAEPAQIVEDDPGWDCETMGNLTCGTVAEGR